MKAFKLNMILIFEESPEMNKFSDSSPTLDEFISDYSGYYNLPW
jgi:hypothetical protein